MSAEAGGTGRRPKRFAMAKFPYRFAKATDDGLIWPLFRLSQKRFTVGKRDESTACVEFSVSLGAQIALNLAPS
jgi:hypothetical protein